MQEIMQFFDRHLILTLSWIALLIAVVIVAIKDFFAKIKNITCSKAIQLINKEEAIIIDLRCRDDFCKGHIINSINLTPLEIKDNNIKELGKYKQKPIIIVSRNGMKTSKSAEQLVQYGFKHVFILKEGIISWSNENLPLLLGKK